MNFAFKQLLNLKLFKMKKIFVLFILLVSIIVNSQTNKKLATVLLKNGTELKGFARIVGNKVRFSKEKRGKDKLYTSDDVESLKLKFSDRYLSILYKTEKNKKTPILVESLIKGKINLYRKLDLTHKDAYYVFAYNIKKGSLFVEKENESTINRFKQNFTKEAKDFFKDCKKLSKLIGTKDYRRKDLFDIVEFYNDECN